MPYLTLRHSDNLKIDFIPFFKKAHSVLCDVINVKPASCSSLVTTHQQYLLGDGMSSNVFIHLDVLVKPKKFTDQLNTISEILLNELNDYLNSHDVACHKASVNVFEANHFSN